MSTIEALQHFRTRLLTPEKKVYVPRRWVFFDSETHTEEHDGIRSEFFSVGWTCQWDRWSSYWPGHYEWHFWEEEEEVCRYFSDAARKARQLMLVGHNIFFDLQACGFFEYFTQWGWELDFLYDKGLTYILRCKRAGATLTVVSSTNWFDQGLKELGRVVGLEKMEVDPHRAAPALLKAYCRRDVEILVRAMRYYIDFITKHRLGKFSLTKASQAFSVYRYRFMHHKILLHSEKDVTALERGAYMGGRTEAFFIGQVPDGPFVTLDVNSMYPYVMQKYQYPWRLVEYNRHMEPERYNDILRTHAVIAEVEVETPEPAFAVRDHGKLLFPVGRFVTFVASTGMKYALERGYLRRIINVAVYSRAGLFSGYVTYFHRLRSEYKKKNNDVMTLLTKYMENSLYGKFGEKKVVRDEYEEHTGRAYWREEVVNIDTGGVTILTKLMNRFIVQYSEEEGRNAFPAIAAHITENARFVLWNIIRSTGRDRVLYCDTDSIKIREKDMKYVIWPRDERALGALKIENRSRELYIGGAKNYRTESERRIKGIPSRAVEVAENVFSFPVFRRQDTHLRGGQIRGTQVGKMTRVVSFAYDKGIVGADGHVTPFSFSLPDEPLPSPDASPLPF